MNQPNNLLNSELVKSQLSDAIAAIMSQQGNGFDKNRLHDAVEQISSEMQPQSQLELLLKLMDLQVVHQFAQPDAVYLPLIAYHQQLGWGVITQQKGQDWLFKQNGQQQMIQAFELSCITQIDSSNAKVTINAFAQFLRENLAQHKQVVLEAVIASLLINFLALATSLFSMQVYDRVIPTHNHNTLIVLSSGVAIIILFETLMKLARSKIMDSMVVGLDQNLSRHIFERLLKVRIDLMPNSVGSLAAQLRGYEQVRGFYTASTLFTLVDLPMSLLFIILIGIIGSPWLSLIPIITAIIGITLGWFSRKKIDKIAAEGAKASYLKTGILVETVEGIETIKAGAGNWKFLSRWLNVMNVTTDNDLKMRHTNDNLNYAIQALQQISYIALVITGSIIVISGNMTMGGLIACTILGGRILAPVMALPNLLVQASHANAAKKNIESLYQIPSDNHLVSKPLILEHIRGDYQCQDMIFNYLGNEQPAVNIGQLTIKAGERIALLGAIGSGKSTLLKLLAGLYLPKQGNIRLDGIDLPQISRDSLNQHIGYLQQNHRLFQGTLRENLLIGMPPPPDSELQQVLQRTGLIRLVASHSSGLDLPISEGGHGLSGGQKQLLAFSRLVLTKPKIWLLDEPTASMDNSQEQQCLRVLTEELKNPAMTLIVATHKMELLKLVDRIIIMDNQKIVMDGSKQAVIQQLMKNEAQQQQMTKS